MAQVALAGAGDGPWDGPALAVFKARVRRAALRAKTPPAATQDAAAVAEATRTWVELDRDQPGLATLLVTGPTEDILWLGRTIDHLATHRPHHDDRGHRVSTGQRQVGALFDLVEHATHPDHEPDSAGGGRGRGDEHAGGSGGGTSLPSRRRQPSRSRELGLVLHADTFFGDGPAAADPGEIRGHGMPMAIPAGTARTQAQRALSSGTATSVLLTGPDGHLQQIVRLGTAPTNGWTRDSLTEAVRRFLARSENSAPTAWRPSATPLRLRSPTTSAPSTPPAPHPPASAPHGPATSTVRMNGHPSGQRSDSDLD